MTLPLQLLCLDRLFRFFLNCFSHVGGFSFGAIALASRPSVGRRRWAVRRCVRRRRGLIVRVDYRGALRELGRDGCQVILLLDLFPRSVTIITNYGFIIHYT